MTQQQRGYKGLEPGRPFHCGLLVAIVVVAAVFTISVMLTAVLWLTTQGSTTISIIRLEVVKHLLQLSIVVIIGGVVTALYRYLEGIRQENRLRAETRADYMKRLGTLYREAKAARRLLRVAGLTTRYGARPDELSGAQADAYRKEMERINHVQLELEALKIEAKSLPEFAAPPLSQLTGHLRAMEHYLGKIVGEYEEFGPKLDSDDKVMFSELECLDEFTGETKRVFRCREYKKRTFLFSVGLEFQADLETGELSPDFRQEFVSHGIILSDDLGIEIQEEGHTWRIKDSDKGLTYIVSREGEALSICRTPRYRFKKHFSEPYASAIELISQYLP